MRLGYTLRVVHFARYCTNSHLLHEAQHFMEEGEEKAGWVDGEKGGEKDRQVDG